MLAVVKGGVGRRRWIGRWRHVLLNFRSLFLSSALLSVCLSTLTPRNHVLVGLAPCRSRHPLATLQMGGSLCTSTSTSLPPSPSATARSSSRSPCTGQAAGLGGTGSSRKSRASSRPLLPCLTFLHAHPRTAPTRGHSNNTHGEPALLSDSLFSSLPQQHALTMVSTPATLPPGSHALPKDDHHKLSSFPNRVALDDTLPRLPSQGGCNTCQYITCLTTHILLIHLVPTRRSQR